MNKRLRDLDDDMLTIGVELEYAMVVYNNQHKELEAIIKKHACKWIAEDYEGKG